MRALIRKGKRNWITPYNKEMERTFFFYATVVMVIVGIILHFLGR